MFVDADVRHRWARDVETIDDAVHRGFTAHLATHLLYPLGTDTDCCSPIASTVSRRTAVDGAPTDDLSWITAGLYAVVGAVRAMHEPTAQRALNRTEQPRNPSRFEIR